MKRKLKLMIGLILVLLVTACGSNNQDQAKDSELDAYSNNNSTDSENYSYGDSDMEMSVDGSDEADSSNDSNKIANDNAAERMIVHTADLYINVKDLAKAQLTLEAKTKEYGGYIVESNVNRIEDEYFTGSMIVRIPEKHFQTFLTDTEDMAAEVVERFITGQDVTEDYVDLESRLKSKKVVEKRLITFMEGATETKDLLTISEDLAQIQEEIELIVGKMNYLENQASFSTIQISMSEEKVVIPEIDSTKLDTWEKTKKQLTTSINGLLSVGSGLIIFFVGNIPIILLIVIAGAIIFLIVRKQFTKHS